MNKEAKRQKALTHVMALEAIPQKVARTYRRRRGQPKALVEGWNRLVNDEKVSQAQLRHLSGMFYHLMEGTLPPLPSEQRVKGSRKRRFRFFRR